MSLDASIFRFGCPVTLFVGAAVGAHTGNRMSSRRAFLAGRGRSLMWSGGDLGR